MFEVERESNKAFLIRMFFISLQACFFSTNSPVFRIFPFTTLPLQPKLKPVSAGEWLSLKIIA